MGPFAALIALLPLADRAMSEHATGTFDARRAWTTIQEASAYEEPLRRRTEGLTWMLWGLVTIGIFLSYDALTPHFHSFDHTTGTETHSPWYIQILWVYWVTAGALFSWVLWRTVALAFAVGPHRPAGLKVTLLWIGAGAVGWTLALILIPNLHPHLTPVVALGIMWLTLGALNLQRATPLGRRVLLTVGFLILFGSLALQPLAPDPGGDLYTLNALRMVAAGAPPFLGGLWQALRG